MYLGMAPTVAATRHAVPYREFYVARLADDFKESMIVAAADSSGFHVPMIASGGS